MVPLTGVEPVRMLLRRILSDAPHADLRGTWRPLEVVGEVDFPRIFREKRPQNGQNRLLRLLLRAPGPS